MCGSSLASVRHHCHLGGRLLHWLPYTDPDGAAGPTPWQHIETGQQMVAELATRCQASSSSSTTFSTSSTSNPSSSSPPGGRAGTQI